MRGLAALGLTMILAFVFLNAFAPMAMARVETAATVNPGDLRNCRSV